jgi:hypothetical protein
LYLPMKSNPTIYGFGNGVCRPMMGKPPDCFSADNSCESVPRSLRLLRQSGGL